MSVTCSLCPEEAPEGRRVYYDVENYVCHSCACECVRQFIHYRDVAIEAVVAVKNGTNCQKVIFEVLFKRMENNEFLRRQIIKKMAA